jgi:hypothetical protein
MSKQTFDNVVDRLSQIPKINKICLYLMNEPLMDNGLFEKINKIKKELTNYNWIEISTNALLLSDATIEKMIDVFRGTNHDIWISFHGADEESYEYNMGLPYDVVLKNIKNFITKASDLHYKIQGVGLPCRDNVSKNFSKKEYVEFWKDQSCADDKIDYFKYIDRAGNVKNTKKYNCDLKGMACVRLENWLHILYTGEVAICCNDYNKEVVLGDINKQTVDDITSSEGLQRYKKILKGELPTPNNFICSRCDFSAVGNYFKE